MTFLFNLTNMQKGSGPTIFPSADNPVVEASGVLLSLFFLSREAGLGLRGADSD